MEVLCLEKHNYKEYIPQQLKLERYYISLIQNLELYNPFYINLPFYVMKLQLNQSQQQGNTSILWQVLKSKVMI